MPVPLPRPSASRPGPGVALLVAVLGTTLLASPVRANVKKVAELLARAGRSGVVRGPRVISRAQKADLEDVARRLSQGLQARVYFVVLPKAADPDKYAALYDRLGMQGADLLAASNGPELAVRCSAISRTDKRKLWQAFRAKRGAVAQFAALAEAVPDALRDSQSKVPVRRPSRQLRPRPSREQRPSREKRPSGNKVSGRTGLIVVFVLLLVGVGVVLVRRKRRDARIAADFSAALDPVEQDLADAYIGMDGLENTPGFDALLSRATSISGQVDALKAERPDRRGISRLRSMVSDVAFIKDEIRKLQTRR